MLGVGIDWSEEFHLLALGRAEEGVVAVRRVAHTPSAVAGLVGEIAGMEPDAAEVRVVIETRHGALVEALLDAGYTVLPVNPDLIARRRGPARKKDDAGDARIACLLALDRHVGFQQQLPHGELAAELRSIARDDARAARDERRLLNRLRADLQAVYPAALVIAGDDLGAPTVLRVLQRFPCTDLLRAAGHQELVDFARAGRHGWPQRFAEGVQTALGAEQFTARDYLVRAKTDIIALAATQLLAINAQRRVWERRMGQLLLGAPRYGRTKQPREDQRGQALPGGEIYLSMPGLGDRLAARVAGEIGDHPEQFHTPNALACYGGRAPVTRQSGKSQFTVARRLAYNHHLGAACQQWAFCSLSNSG